MTSESASKPTAQGVESRSQDAAPVEFGSDIGKVPRWVIGIFGGLSLCVSSAALFFSENQAGTVAIALLGAVMLTVALMGRWPSRISWRETVVEFAVRKGLSDPDPDVRAEAIAAAVDVSAGKNSYAWLSGTQTAFGFEDSALAELRDVLPAGWSLRVGGRIPRFRMDGLLVSSKHGTRPILVEIESRPLRTDAEVKAMVNQSCMYVESRIRNNREGRGSITVLLVVRDVSEVVDVEGFRGQGIFIAPFLVRHEFVNAVLSATALSESNAEEV